MGYLFSEAFSGSGRETLPTVVRGYLPSSFEKTIEFEPGVVVPWPGRHIVVSFKLGVGQYPWGRVDLGKSLPTQLEALCSFNKSKFEILSLGFPVYSVGFASYENSTGSFDYLTWQGGGGNLAFTLPFNSSLEGAVENQVNLKCVDLMTVEFEAWINAYN